MNEMFVKKRDIRITAAFSPVVNLRVPSNISKPVSIVQMIEKKKINLTYYMTVRNTLPGLPRYKVLSIIDANLH